MPQVFLGPRHGGGPLDITRDGGKTWESQNNKLNATGDAGPGPVTTRGGYCEVEHRTFVEVKGDWTPSRTTVPKTHAASGYVRREYHPPACSKNITVAGNEGMKWTGEEIHAF